MRVGRGGGVRGRVEGVRCPRVCVLWGAGTGFPACMAYCMAYHSQPMIHPTSKEVEGIPVDDT